MGFLKTIMLVLFLLTCVYRLFYMVLRKKRPVNGETLGRYAVMISARNEEKVIGLLLDSIRKQNYPAELIDIYVVADNCTDATAQIAREHGAFVTERFDTVHIGKGYALTMLYDLIQQQPAKSYDGYFIFDADNVLDTDYIRHMNSVFMTGQEVVVGYRTAKNFDDNWITAAYGVYFIYESEFANRARDLIGASAFLSGTGCLFSQGFLDGYGGWKWHGLTEDLECTSELLLDGHRVAYCTDAVLYDEQPRTFRASLTQRVRWVKGYLLALRENGGKLVKKLFSRHGFPVYDFLMNIGPLTIFILAMVIDIADLAAAVVRGEGAAAIVGMIGGKLGSVYGGLYLMGVVTLLAEWKRILAPAWKKLLYTLTFPVFMFSFILIYFMILTCSCEWKPMEHTAQVSIEDLSHCKCAKKRKEKALLGK